MNAMPVVVDDVESPCEVCDRSFFFWLLHGTSLLFAFPCCERLRVTRTSQVSLTTQVHTRRVVNIVMTTKHLITERFPHGLRRGRDGDCPSLNMNFVLVTILQNLWGWFQCVCMWWLMTKGLDLVFLEHWVLAGSRSTLTSQCGLTWNRSFLLALLCFFSIFASSRVRKNMCIADCFHFTAEHSVFHWRCSSNTFLVFFFSSIKCFFRIFHSTCIKNPRMQDPFFSVVRIQWHTMLSLHCWRISVCALSSISSRKLFLQMMNDAFRNSSLTFSDPAQQHSLTPPRNWRHLFDRTHQKRCARSAHENSPKLTMIVDKLLNPRDRHKSLCTCHERWLKWFSCFLFEHVRSWIPVISVLFAGQSPECQKKTFTDWFCENSRSAEKQSLARVRCTFIQIAKKNSSKNTFIQKHFRPKTLSSEREDNFIHDTFIQKRVHPMTLSSQTIFIQWHFHPKTVSSNDTFIPNHFHPILTLSSKSGFIQWHFHPKPFSSNFDTFIQKRFHPTLNTKPQTPIPKTLNPKHLFPKHPNPKHLNPKHLNSKHQNPKHLNTQTLNPKP